MPGSHRFLLSIERPKILDRTALPPAIHVPHISQVLAASNLEGVLNDRSRGGVGPVGSGAEPKDSAADSLISPVDGAAFVDGPVQKGEPPLAIQTRLQVLIR